MLANAGAYFLLFAHGGTTDLKKNVFVKLKVITKQNEFKEDK